MIYSIFDVYPNGTYLGFGVVFTYNSNGNLEYLTVQNSSYTGENVGSGTGSALSFGHTLTHYPVLAGSIVIHYTIGSVQYTAADNGSGSITGTYISSGTVNYETGQLNLTYSTAPDNNSNINADYTFRPYTWAGNVCTIKITGQIANNYTAANTYAGVCISLGDIKTSCSSITKTSASGQFDGTKILLDNRGTVEDTWTISFTSSTAFTVSGTIEGGQTAGSINSDYAPVNPNTGQQYFKIPSAAWSGTWAVNDTLQFNTHPAAAAIWWKEVVPANTPAYSENGCMLEVYFE